VAAASQGDSSQLNADRLLQLNLLGNVVQNIEEQPKAIEAPITKLRLTLRGIYASDTPGKANAIIENDRGEQAVYFINEPLQVAGRVYLRQVFPDKVILETNGKNEALKLETEELKGAIISRDDERMPADDERGAPEGDVQQLDRRSDVQLTQQLNEYRDKFVDNPASMADVISGDPYVVDGELIGFRLAPGKDRRLFEQMGLRRGDIVTSVNGVQLNDMQQAMSLMKDVQLMQEVTVDIQRDGEQLNLLLNLNEKK